MVEERGLRAASRLAQGAATDGRTSVATDRDRGPGSVLGLLLDRDGPGALGDHLARFADAAIVDSRVLSPTGWVPRSPAGRPPRIASHPTCCSPRGSPTRGSAS